MDPKFWISNFHSRILFSVWIFLFLFSFALCASGLPCVCSCCFYSPNTSASHNARSPRVVAGLYLPFLYFYLFSLIFLRIQIFVFTSVSYRLPFCVCFFIVSTPCSCTSKYRTVFWPKLKKLLAKTVRRDKKPDSKNSTSANQFSLITFLCSYIESIFFLLVLLTSLLHRLAWRNKVL